MKHVPSHNYLVSALVSTYNSERFLPGCLEDLFQQTLYRQGQLEIIVVDSGSQQGEGEVVRRLQPSHPHLRYLRTGQRETVYQAWNRGIEAASGDFVTNANTDDRHAPHALERLARFLQDNDQVQLVYADSLITRTDHATWQEPHCTGVFRWPDPDPRLLFDCCLMGPHPMWRRSLHERHGLFDGALRSAGDYDFWLRLSRAGVVMAHLREVLGLYLENADSISLSDGALNWRESELARDRHWPASWGKRPQTRYRSFARPLSRAALSRIRSGQPVRGRVLLCCDYFWPSVGGVELYVEDLARVLLGEGFEVEVAARWLAEREGLEHDLFTIHQFRCAGGVAAGKVSGEGEQFRDLVLHGGYHAVLALSQPDNWVGMALWELPAPRPRIVFLPSINARDIEEWQRQGLQPRLSRLLAAVDRVVAVTESGHDARFLASVRDDVQFLPHAVRQDADPADFRQRCQIPAHRPLLVMVANFWPVKNHLGLLDALSLVPGDWQLLLIGNFIDLHPEYRQEVVRRALADRRVRLIGPLPRQLAAAAIRDADLLLVPSKGESAGPLVLLQAMSYATPWLATPACNAVRDLAGGVLAEVAEFPAAIAGLLARPEERAELGRLGERHWRSCFTWEKSVPGLVALIEGGAEQEDLRMPLPLRVANAQLKGRLALGEAAGRGAAPHFSVIIPTYNRCAILRRCLDALALQEFPFAAFEVIVCDDGSSDQTGELVPEYRSPYRLRYLRQENRGPAAARNLGIAQAQGEYLLILNDDAIAEPDLLARHLAAHRRHVSDRIAVLGRFPFAPEHAASPLGHLLDHSDLLFQYGELTPHALHDYRYFYTCNLSVSRQAVLDAGLFDEGFTGPAAEDLELGYRLGLAGYRVLYDPSCLTWHDHGTSVSSFCRVHKVRGSGSVTLFLKQPALNWYRKLDQATAAAWRRRLERQEARVKALIARAEELNHGAGESLTPDRLARRAAALKPLLRKLQHHFMLQGVLASPHLDALIAANRLPAPPPAGAGRPLVSVIVTCYNYARFLEAAVQSVLAQSYRDFEIVIVNDGSTDQSGAVADALAAAHPGTIRVLHQENSGQPAISRNNGIRISRGSYLLCLDADDLLAPEYIEACVQVLERNPSVSIAYTDQLYFDEAGSREVKLCRYSLRRLLKANFISCCSLYRRRAWEDAGGYRTNVKGYEDWDFWIACAEHGHFGRWIPRPLFHYRQHGTGLYASALPDHDRLRAQVVLNHASLYSEPARRWARETVIRCRKREAEEFRVVALIAAHNEGDVIGHVIGDLVEQGVFVYLIDHCSSDDTRAQASRWLGRGLLHIENFPADAGYPEQNSREYLWSHLLRRKEELSAAIDADWFIHHDADEFRESPWQGVALAEAIRKVDLLGYNAIGFSLLDFHPVDDRFQPGADVREALSYFERGESFNQLQVKAWKKQPKAVNLVGSGGHCVHFPDKRTFPIRFLLRHYPVRSQAHGMEKVFKRRKERFNAQERGTGWHKQYDHIADQHFNFLRDAATLTLFDGAEVRGALIREDAALLAAQLGAAGAALQDGAGGAVERCAELIGAPPAGLEPGQAPDPEYLGLLKLLAQIREAEAAQLHSDPKNRLSLLGRGVKLWHFCRIRAGLAASRLRSLRGPA